MFLFVGIQFAGAQSNMERRQAMYPEFGISKRLERFQPPPSQPPKGKDVLERLFDVLFSQEKNKRSVESAAATVAEELLALWALGDARIPLNAKDTVRNRFVSFREELAYLNKKAMKARSNYQTKVREPGCFWIFLNFRDQIECI